jgi:large repetitive protein
LFGYIPSVDVTASSLTILSQLEVYYAQSSVDDKFIFAFKELSGDGSIIAKIADISGGSEALAAGIGIRDSLDVIFGSGPMLALCMKSSKLNLEFKYRNKVDSPSKQYIFPHNVIGELEYWLRLTKFKNVLTCEFSTDNKESWEKYSEEIIFSKNFYVGLVEMGEKGVISSAKFSDVDFIGFQGFCNDRGNCQTVKGSFMFN